MALPVNVKALPPAVANTEGLIIGKVREIEEVNNVRIRSYPCPKVNDKSLIESWSWTQAASIVISAASAYVGYKVAQDQYDIADKYWRLARDEWDFFRDNYRPLEEKEIREIRAEKPHVAEYEEHIAGHIDAVDNIIAKSEAHRENLLAKYCMCEDAGLYRNYSLSESVLLGDLNNFARRYAENDATKLNDRRRNRRIAAANRGRDMLQSTTAFASKANAEWADYAETMTGLAKGAAEYAQYLGTKRQTRYNSRNPSRVATRISQTTATPAQKRQQLQRTGDYADAGYQNIDYNGADAYNGNNMLDMGSFGAGEIAGYNNARAYNV